ncbi:hypothetical protein FSP39_013535 [Pinctada imbricata]|uniref:BTB domain-containing protein n=1 Tax=Pinctada imbricata TaxID=66713 RepID=A0AA88XNF9_PINIB|nr:hypothetical protein FSP39_013535 [Pinctada imbricata]
MYTSLPIRRGTLGPRQDDQGSSSQLNLFSLGRSRLHDDKSDEDLRKRFKKRNKSSAFAKTLLNVIKKKKYKEVDWYKVFINVGGVKFVTYQGTLSNFPNTKLGKLNDKSSDYDSINGEYFFDRNPHLFQYILDYQRKGTIHVPRSFCAKTIRDELEFWELDDRALDSCCRKFFFETMSDILQIEALEESLKSAPERLYDVLSETSTENTRTWKDKVWLFLDNARSSLAAKIWSYFYMLLVFISIASIFIGTLPSCRVQNGKFFKRHTSLPHLSFQTFHSLTTQPHDALIFIDLICMLFFTFEFFLRIYVCPRKLRLFCRASTIFDLLYLLPVWILFLTDAIDSTFWNHIERITYLLFMQAIMILRVFRIFRLLRHYRGLKILWLAIRASVGELLLLFVFVMFCITIYAGFIYCAELFNDEAYENILVGMYWALITMTTVGYGDISPSTWAGSIVASICALTGIILIGMPVPIIASNFHAYYGMHVMDEDDLFIPPKPHAKKLSKEKINDEPRAQNQPKEKVDGGTASGTTEATEKKDNESADSIQKAESSQTKTTSGANAVLVKDIDTRKVSKNQVAPEVSCDQPNQSSELANEQKILSVRQGIYDNLRSRNLSLSTLPSHLVVEELIESEHIGKVCERPIPTISLSSSTLDGEKSKDHNVTAVDV